MKDGSIFFAVVLHLCDSMDSRCKECTQRTRLSLKIQCNKADCMFHRPM